MSLYIVVPQEDVECDSTLSVQSILSGMQEMYNLAKSETPDLNTELFITKLFFLYQENICVNTCDLNNALTFVRQEYGLAALIAGKYKTAIAIYLKSNKFTVEIVEKIINAFYANKSVDAVMPVVEEIPAWKDHNYKKDYTAFAEILNKFHIVEETCTADLLIAFACGNRQAKLTIRNKMLNAFTLIIGMMREKGLLPEGYQSTMERKSMVTLNGKILKASQFKNSKRNYWPLVSIGKSVNADDIANNIYEQIVDAVRTLENSKEFKSKPIVDKPNS